MRYGRVALVAVIVLTFGDVAAGEQRQLGLKIGASIANLDPGPSQLTLAPYDPRIGFTWGVFGVLPIRSRISAQIEALFTEKGGQQPVNDPSIVSGSIDDRLQFHYLDLPVSLRVTGPYVRSARFHAFAGPTLSILFSAKQQTVFSGLGSFGYEYDIDNDVDRFDVGLTFGAGADIGQRVVVDARYTYGLADVLVRQGGTPVSNRGFLLTAGIRIFQR